jgi:hypothetical protein
MTKLCALAALLLTTTASAGEPATDPAAEARPATVEAKAGAGSGSASGSKGAPSASKGPAGAKGEKSGPPHHPSHGAPAPVPEKPAPEKKDVPKPAEQPCEPVKPCSID